MTDRDVDELVRLIRIYLPLNPARQLVGDLYRSRAAERDPHLKETLRCVKDALGGASAVRPYEFTSRDTVLEELARYLPDNENVRRGDVVASIRDLAQVAMSEADNAREYERALTHARVAIVNARACFDRIDAWPAQKEEGLSQQQQSICSCCGCLETKHETTAYRGDKPRACLDCHVCTGFAGGGS